VIFNTWTFALFAVVALAIYWAVIPQKLRPYYLITIGCIFYAWSVPAFLVLIVALSLVTFVISKLMLRAGAGQTAKKALLTLGVVLITGVLVFFKYTRFFAATVNQVARHDILPIPHIVVPLAISFFTFEFVHVLVDVYLGKIKKIDALEFATFSMFFPTLVAGPIKRYQSFAPQVRAIELPSNRDLGLNLYRVLIGLAKKIVVADSMSILTVPLTAPGSAPFGRIDYIVAMLAYTTKIYFDFTGYSDIAIGVSGLLGLRIPENFDRPYRATNISVFWRRWHMSLSTWIRDYIFIPLGGSRHMPIITMLNLLVAMALAGLWHGAAWTFVIWGLWQGLGLAVHRIWASLVVPRIAAFSRPSILVTITSICITFAFVTVGWVIFAASSFPDVLQVLKSALVPSAAS
jgi:alginate O-acetyltransferase complex protein AlgI